MKLIPIPDQELIVAREGIELSYSLVGLAIATRQIPFLLQCWTQFMCHHIMCLSVVVRVVYYPLPSWRLEPENEADLLALSAKGPWCLRAL